MTPERELRRGQQKFAAFTAVYSSAVLADERSSYTGAVDTSHALEYLVTKFLSARAASRRAWRWTKFRALSSRQFFPLTDVVKFLMRAEAKSDGTSFKAIVCLWPPRALKTLKKFSKQSWVPSFRRSQYNINAFRRDFKRWGTVKKSADKWCLMDRLHSWNRGKHLFPTTGSIWRYVLLI
ncbi:Guanine nucleotide-binding protein alpha-1 subunit [Frankliniella fusca]|uniref:Guanine nucleotide-binding protein alpha-1 subunit n=1 Tax=Frankliniella fusca TaxID=407009 RepID=A0AAE1HGG3_9NEOP|nr:Guanine nucleotide-binding protein alpha-1 subunit [Frankliniella fusca]